LKGVLGHGRVSSSRETVSRGSYDDDSFEDEDEFSDGIAEEIEEDLSEGTEVALGAAPQGSGFLLLILARHTWCCLTMVSPVCS
jgi:protein required for attachment to host cells